MAPVEVGFTVPPGSADKVRVKGGFAYVAGTSSSGAYGLRLIDVRTPTSPFDVGFFETPEPNTSIAVSRGRVFVANPRTGITVFRFCDLVFADDFESGDLLFWSWPNP